MIVWSARPAQSRRDLADEPLVDRRTALLPGPEPHATLRIVISLAVVYAGFFVLAPICALVQRAFGDRAPPVFARRRAIDWIYWVFTPLFTGVLTRAATL